MQLPDAVTFEFKGTDSQRVLHLEDFLGGGSGSGGFCLPALVVLKLLWGLARPAPNLYELATLGIQETPRRIAARCNAPAEVRFLHGPGKWVGGTQWGSGCERRNRPNACAGHFDGATPATLNTKCRPSTLWQL